jgi:hypothetical protein
MPTGRRARPHFGTGTAFEALVGEVKGMARAIAAMELLGPNPEATVRYVKDRVAGDPELFKPGKLRKRDKAAKHGKVVQRLWDEYTGALRQPEGRTLAVVFSTYRGLASAAKLGSAPVTAIGDLGYGMATRRFNGLPVAGIVRDYLKLLNPADPSHRLAAAYLSFVPEVWTSAVSGQSRFLAEELTGEFGRRVSDGVLRAPGSARSPRPGARRTAWSPSSMRRWCATSLMPSSSRRGARRSSAIGSAKRNGTRSGARRPRSSTTVSTC